MFGMKSPENKILTAMAAIAQTINALSDEEDREIYRGAIKLLKGQLKWLGRSPTFHIHLLLGKKGDEKKGQKLTKEEKEKVFHAIFSEMQSLDSQYLRKTARQVASGVHLKHLMQTLKAAQLGEEILDIEFEKNFEKTDKFMEYFEESRKLIKLARNRIKKIFGEDLVKEWVTTED